MGLSTFPDFPAQQISSHLHGFDGPYVFLGGRALSHLPISFLSTLFSSQLAVLELYLLETGENPGRQSHAAAFSLYSRTEK